VLRIRPTTTVGQILKDAVAIGYNRYNVMSHLRWLYTWGDFLEIDGQRYFPEVKQPEPEVEVRPVVIAEKKKAVVKHRRTKRTKRKARR
jgi:hypothetical protein